MGNTRDILSKMHDTRLVLSSWIRSISKSMCICTMWDNSMMTTTLNFLSPSPSLKYIPDFFSYSSLSLFVDASFFIFYILFCFFEKGVK